VSCPMSRGGGCTSEPFTDQVRLCKLVATQGVPYAALNPYTALNQLGAVHGSKRPHDAVHSNHAVGAKYVRARAGCNALRLEEGNLGWGVLKF
jgi:hypothetical protein